MVVHTLASCTPTPIAFRAVKTGGYDWVGWRNDSLGWAGKPVEMVFEFDSVRNFSSMVLHTNNMFSKDVQVFVHAKVFFSIGGQHFTGEPVQFSYMPDTVMENARDVTIKLHHRVGRYVQIHLYFALRWIMLSEISFTSAVCQTRDPTRPMLNAARPNISSFTQNRTRIVSDQQHNHAIGAPVMIRSFVCRGLFATIYPVAMDPFQLGNAFRESVVVIAPFVQSPSKRGQ
uniref:Discoidin domain-containing protein n=1 Tax=Anopheles minimus TaxID=112268 RepID=A0A182VTI9_9DIPT